LTLIYKSNQVLIQGLYYYICRIIISKERAAGRDKRKAEQEKGATRKGQGAWTMPVREGQGKSIRAREGVHLEHE